MLRVVEEGDRLLRSGNVKVVPKQLKGNGAGIYLLENKIGMTDHFYERVVVWQGKSNTTAAILMSYEECQSFLVAIQSVSGIDAVKQLTALELPRFYYHSDHTNKQQQHITLQVVEAILSSYYKAGTGPVAEMLSQTPSSEILSSYNYIDQQFRDDMNVKMIQDAYDGIREFDVAMAWETFPSFLRRHSHPLAQKNMQQVSPDEHTFVTKYMFQVLFDTFNNYNNNNNKRDTVQSYIDMVDHCPRASQLESLFEFLKPKLESIFSKTMAEDAKATKSKELEKEIRFVKEQIRRLTTGGDLWQHYIAPDHMTVGKSTADYIAKRYKEYKDGTMPRQRAIWMEENNLRDALQYCPEIMSTIFRNTTVQVLVSRPSTSSSSSEIIGEHCVLQSNDGFRVFTGLCFYRILSEETTFQVRLRSARSLYACQRALNLVGIIKSETVSKTKNEMISFLMTADGIGNNGTGSFREGRFNYLPKGFCLGHGRDVLSVSKNIGGNGGVHYTTAVYLQILAETHSSRHLWNTILSLYNMTASTPMDPDFVCPGHPAVGIPGTKDYMPSKPCTSWNLDDRDDCPGVTCCFADNADHPYHKQFICQDCQTGIAPRALKMLELLDQHNMTDSQLELLNSLVEKKQKHAEYVREALANDYKTDPEGTKLKVQTKTFRQTTNRSMDEEFQLSKSRKNKEQYKAHVAGGGKKKKSNPKRTTTRNVVYPSRVKKLLKEATRILVQHGGRLSYESKEINEVHDRIIMSEAVRQPDGQFALVDETTGRPLFHITSLIKKLPRISKTQQDLALKPYLHPAKTGKRSRDVIDPPADVDHQMQKRLKLFGGSNESFYDWVVATAYKKDDAGDGDTTSRSSWTKVTGDDLVQQGAAEMDFNYDNDDD